MNACMICGVPFVLVRMDQERQIATFQCPVCGYVVDVPFTVAIPGQERYPQPNTHYE
jgi:hypothetical protein